ncbi:MAG: UvrD-helicase domain-containing protein [Candidatus Methanomethyliaceae archaeon]
MSALILTPSQLEAVTFSGGPLLVLAGAGSGKTAVVTHRIAHLIEQGIPSGRILAITFTRKAASEMKERVLKLTGVESRWISTFHSFCLRILREHLEELQTGLREGFTVYDERDAFRLFERICAENRYGRDEAALFRKISYLRQHGEIEEHMFGEDLQAYGIYRKYERALVEANAVDFDGIQLFARMILGGAVTFTGNIYSHSCILVIPHIVKKSRRG